MNYPKLLLEKYALVKEDNKEDILTGLEEVGKDRELYNLFKSISGVRGTVTAEEKQLSWYIDRVEEDALATWLWDQGIWRREAERIWDTMPQDEKNEITIKKIEKWISDNPNIKNEICPNITIEDVERLLRDYPDNTLDEGEKDDILAGLSDIESQSKRENEYFSKPANIVNGFNRVYGDNTQDEYNFVRNALRVGLGMDEDEIKKINITEIVLNSQDVGEEIDNFIQGWQDPNLIFSPGEVLLFKLKQISQDRNDGTLHQRYYYYEPVAEYWEWEHNL